MDSTRANAEAVTWKQPAPTKRFAAWYKGQWYAEGDSPEACRHFIRISAKACPSRFWRELWRGMVITENTSQEVRP